MNDSALNRPVNKPRRETNTADMQMGQKDDLDLSIGATLTHGESLVDVAGDVTHAQQYMSALAFMEEPVTIRIEENSRSDFPETHVPVAVNGKDAEVLQNGSWLSIGWLPIGAALTTKRKYVEVLARSRSDSIKTVHDDANVERPRNTLNRRTSSNYPLSIIQDNNPRGHEWLSRIMMGH